MPNLPTYAPVSLIAERLPLIFPDGTPNRSNCIGGAAANTVFASIYIGAVEGFGQELGPVFVYRMTEEQSRLSSDDERNEYYSKIRAKKGGIVGTTRWYADNTREQIRDDALIGGLVSIGAVVRRSGMATTSSVGRYVLKADFAALFDPALTGDDLDQAIVKFRDDNLSKGALSRVAIMLSGAKADRTKITITFPNGDNRQLAPGPSSIISRAVVEVFAPKFLEDPVVLWLSESGNKVVLQDKKIASQLGIVIDPKTTLPDLILADMGPQDPMLVFVEVVATDGPVNDARQAAFYQITDAAGFARKHVAMVTAYSDRQSPGFKKTIPHLAWGSFAWFSSEPDNVILMREGRGQFLHQLTL
jgi:hypothetical protein